MQGCLSYRETNDAERFIYMGDGKSVEVEVIGHFRLLLNTELFFFGFERDFYYIVI